MQIYKYEICINIKSRMEGKKRLAMRILTPQAIKNGASLESLNDSTCYLPLEKVFLWFFH